MTGDTILQGTLVDSVLVTLAAVCGFMRTRKREGCFRTVIEIRSHPLSFRMTYRTVLRISCCFMSRIDCRGVITQMAGNAILRCPLVDSILMAAGTGYCCMAPGQWELGRSRVIKGPTKPGRCTVAGGACLRELRRFMIRI